MAHSAAERAFLAFRWLAAAGGVMKDVQDVAARVWRRFRQWPWAQQAAVWLFVAAAIFLFAGARATDRLSQDVAAAGTPQAGATLDVSDKIHAPLANAPATTRVTKATPAPATTTLP